MLAAVKSLIFPRRSDHGPAAPAPAPAPASTISASHPENWVETAVRPAPQKSCARVAPAAPSEVAVSCAPISSGYPADLVGTDITRAGRYRVCAGIGVLVVQVGDGGPARWRHLNSMRQDAIFVVVPRLSLTAPNGWSEVLGATGSSRHAMPYLDRAEDFSRLGKRVYLWSAQSETDLREIKKAKGIRVPLLSDPRCFLAEALGLPTFLFEGKKYFKHGVLVTDSKGTICEVRDTFLPAGTKAVPPSLLGGPPPLRLADDAADLLSQLRQAQRRRPRRGDAQQTMACRPAAIEQVTRAGHASLSQLGRMKRRPEDSQMPSSQAKRMRNSFEKARESGPASI